MLSSLSLPNNFSAFIIAATTIICLLFATFYLIKRWYFSNYYVAGLPPLLKINPFLLVAKLKSAEIFGEYYKQSKLLGSLFCIELPFFPSPTIICGDIGLARIMLTGNEQYEEADKHLLFYDGVLKLCKGPNMIAMSSTIPQVHATRKGLSQSFSTISLNKNFKAYNATLNKFIHVLSDTAKTNKPVDITTLLSAFTFDFLTAGLYRQDFLALDGEGTEGGKLLKEFLIIQKEIFVNQMYDPLRIHYFWNKEVKRAREAHDYVLAFIKRVITLHRSTHTIEEISNDGSILGHLLSSDAYASDDERVRDLLAFTVAGFDTTKSTLAWLFLELTRHPEALAKIQAELDRINPDRSVPFDVSHVSQLDYTVNAIKEAMRLWPAVPGGMHAMLIYCYLC